MTNFISFIIVGAGGFFGAIVRLGLINIFNTQSFTYGTLFANSLGSFLAGVFFVIISEKLVLTDAYRLALIVGFCGSLTTLSAISLDSVNLFLNDDYYLAILNFISNIILSVVFVIIGIYLTRLLTFF